MARKKKEKETPNKIIYQFPEGKYVLGDVDELFEEPFLKKVKSSVKKIMKKDNHGIDDKLNFHCFRVTDKCIDLIEYQSKILTPGLSLILCKDDIIKSGKLRFCRRFATKEPFYIHVDYKEDDDWCLYFWYNDSPSPFMMWQGETFV